MQALNQSSTLPATSIRQAGDDNSLSSLLGGIINDLQDLLEDHLHLMKLEVEEDVQKSKDAVVPLVMGSTLLLGAFVLFMEMLIGWLNYLVPSVPWYGWSGIIAVVTTVIAILLLMMARRKWHLVHALPEKTLRTVKKTIQSINDQVNTDKL